jgi:hypothetical protein
MQIIEVSEKEYSQLVKPGFFFDSAGFNELNKAKVNELKYLVFKDSKYRLGIVVGVKDCIAKCPFSAPFSSFSHVKDEMSVKQFDECVQTLDEYLLSKVSAARFVLPPMFYVPDDIACLLSAFSRSGFSVTAVDLNFQIDLSQFEVDAYINKLHYNAKKNFLRSCEMGFGFEECRSEEWIKRAYDVIADNRAAKGYPLRMTWDQILNTLKIVKHDVFVVRNGEEDVAAAILYRLNDQVSQVIYWGDKPGFSECRPMNYLSHEVVMHCKKQGVRYLDIGPSTEDGVPNYGLCDFKQSIGCGVSAKLTLTKEYGNRELNGLRP